VTERVSDELLRRVLAAAQRSPGVPREGGVELVAELAAELLDARDRIARAAAVLEVSPWHSTTTFCTVCHARAILTGDADV
jgi:hypothetical protein